jgi:hypothetical protein
MPRDKYRKDVEVKELPETWDGVNGFAKKAVLHRRQLVEQELQHIASGRCEPHVQTLVSAGANIM